MKYLIVSFGDNDYGFPMIAALETLWKHSGNTFPKMLMYPIEYRDSLKNFMQ